MPEAESFDAFYARTAWSITSQMREQTSNDPLADHAIREAYAKAYQQWYQVSGYRDPQAWVLATARDAYDRRRADAGPGTAGPPGPAAGRRGSNLSTWPGIYRPRRRREVQPGAGEPAAPAPAAPDPGASAAQPAAPGPAAPDPGAPAAQPAAAPAARAPGAPAGAYGTRPGPSGAAELRAGSIGASPGTAGTSPATAAPSPAATAGATPATAAPTPMWLPGSRRTVVLAGLAVAVVLIAVIGYAISGGKPGTPAASAGRKPGTTAKSGPRMLPAGRTGPRSAIPWSLVGPGWALAEYSTAAAGPDGRAAGSGTYVTYLVDPAGGKYRVTAFTDTAEPALMAWSGDARTALLATGPSVAGPAGYRLLSVHTGRLTPLNLPPGVAAVGFTRPDGLAVLAVRTQAGKFWLQRYALDGAFQATIAVLPRKAATAWPATGCSSACAISSPDGRTDVWGINGDVMTVVSNAPHLGKPRKLKAPRGGPSCVPLSWWSADTVLASCAPGTDRSAARLWLIPVRGSSPTPLTPDPRTAPGSGGVAGAWQTAGAMYVTTASSRQCQGAPGGAPGLEIKPATTSGLGVTVQVPGSTGNMATVVATAGRRLLVLAQTSCPGTSSLLWFNPATGASEPVLGPSAGQLGVVAAVPYGNGPTAVSAGVPAVPAVP